MRNLHLTFDHSTYSQKLGEDFAKFCGLLRIYELFVKPFRRSLVEFEFNSAQICQKDLIKNSDLQTNQAMTLIVLTL